MKLSCLVIEDEQPAQEVMKLYIAECPVLELAGLCTDAFKASELLRTQRIDLIFLDINLPGLSGINFLRSLNQPPMVIFTTAYPEFAIEGFDSDAVDYLVKPFSFDRFLKAVNKAIERNLIRNRDLSSDSGAYLILRADKKIFRVNIADILYAESTGDYLKVFFENKHLVIHETINRFLEQLPVKDFIRVHKSFIVAVNKINYIEGNQIRIKESFIPIGRSYKENLDKLLKKDNRDNIENR